MIEMQNLRYKDRQWDDIRNTDHIIFVADLKAAARDFLNSRYTWFRKNISHTCSAASQQLALVLSNLNPSDPQSLVIALQALINNFEGRYSYSAFWLDHLFPVLWKYPNGSISFPEDLTEPLRNVFNAPSLPGNQYNFLFRGELFEKMGSWLFLRFLCDELKEQFVKTISTAGARNKGP